MLRPSPLRQAEEELSELHTKCSRGKHLRTSVPLGGRYPLKCSSVPFRTVQNTAAVINIPLNENSKLMASSRVRKKKQR